MAIQTLLEKIKSKLAAANISGGSLEAINFIDYGATLPPLPSLRFPLIFIGVDNSLHPIKRAIRGLDPSYTRDYNILIAVVSYIVKGDFDGYKAAFVEATGLFKAVLTICHANKKWDKLCYTSEASEAEAVDWGEVPWEAGADDVFYGISLTLTCRDIQN